MPAITRGKKVDTEGDNKGVRRALSFQPTAALERKSEGEKAPSSKKSVPTLD